MLRQYKVLTSCLAELKASNLPAISKLKLELQITRIKRVLLEHDVAHRFAGVASSEQAFADLYDHVRLVCTSSCTDHAANKLMSHLDDSRNSLGSGASSDNNGRLEPKGFGGRALNAVVKYAFQGGHIE